MSRRIPGFIALLLALTVAACDDGTDAPEAGTMTLLLTDEPGDITQAIVTIERVEMVGDGEAEVLLDEPFTTDLLTLSNDFATLVDEVTVPGGSYAQLRFVIPEACIVVEDVGTYASDGFDDCGPADGELQLPSFDASGLKVNLPGGAQEIDGDAHIILVDFDVSQSFGQQAGNSGRWVMTPVIRADDFSASGGITVELTVPDSVDLDAIGASLADFQVRIDTEEAPQPFTDDDQDGTYTATFSLLLPDAEYEISLPELKDGVTAFDFTLSPDAAQTVTLGSGQQVTVSFEVTSASTP
jgi:hypothetical protein